ncbi:hypothetical protein PAHA111176_00440 [Parendozoicomonas haliclonae]|uniref:Tetratricopeptide repeat protein n=2 Tax=Parendozoicomonas haliclonae TaxID=1960125 RepID=A0A1X7AFX3_9GAMM|nr:hypothetical protein EHSB41UT_00893 [Parendozoicomonas haliclonae]
MPYGRPEQASSHQERPSHRERDVSSLAEQLEQFTLPATSHQQKQLLTAIQSPDTFARLPTNLRLRTLCTIYLHATEQKDRDMLGAFIDHITPDDLQRIFTSRGDDLPLQCWALWLNASMVLFQHSARDLMALHTGYREVYKLSAAPGEELVQTDHRSRCRTISLYRSCRQFPEGIKEVELLIQWIIAAECSDDYRNSLMLELKQEEAHLYLELGNPHLAMQAIQAAERLEKTLKVCSGVLPVLRSEVLRRESQNPELSDDEKRQKLQQALEQVQPDIETYEGSRTQAARILKALGQFNDALVVLEGGGDNNEFRQRLQAMCLVKVGRYQEAFDILDGLIRSNENFCKLWHEIAICCEDWSKESSGEFSAQKMQNALTYCIHSIRLDSNYASTWSTLGHILKDLKDYRINWHQIRRTLPDELKDCQSLDTAAEQAFRQADKRKPERVSNSMGDSLANSIHGSLHASLNTSFRRMRDQQQ